MEAPRSIVVLLKGYPRLSETFIAQELLGLERAGFRLVIASMRQPTDPATHPVHDCIQAPVLYLPEYLYRSPIRVIRGVLSSARMPGFRFALRAWAADLLRDFTPNRFRRFGQAAVLASEMPTDAQWIYTHFIHTPSAVARYASLITGLPWSVSAHAKDIWTTPDWELSRNLASARWAVTCTRAGQGRLAEVEPQPNHVRLIYHGLDLERFSRREASDSLRDGSDPAQPIRLLAVGRAVEKKGFDTLLDALATISPSLSWRLTHVGGGPLLKSLQKKSRKLGIGNRIDWLGPQSQLSVLNAYRNADVFVLPCRTALNGDRDGLPNVLMEAQSQRLACISTGVGGIPELIRDGETGLLVPPDDPDELARAVMRLIQDPALRNKLAEAGEYRVRTIFDMRGGMEQLASLFRRSLRDEVETGLTEATQ